MQPRSLSVSGSRAAEVAAARAEEAAALSDIDKHLVPGNRAQILDALAGRVPGMIVVEGKTAEMNSRFQRFYAARATRIKEERLQRSIDAAHARGGIRVVVTLGRPATGTMATVFRRVTRLPSDVIVVDPNASSQALGAAFAALDQSRASLGDDLDEDMELRLQEAHAATITPEFQQRLDGLMRRLREVSPRSIDGIGIVRAIDLRSAALPNANR